MYVQAVAKCVNPFKINPTNSELKCVQYVCEISPKGEAVSQEEAGPKLNSKQAVSQKVAVRPWA